MRVCIRLPQLDISLGFRAIDAESLGLLRTVRCRSGFITADA